MIKNQPFIPTALLRTSNGGSFKMRFSFSISPKYSQRRVQLGLHTRNINEAETLSSIICKTLIIIGLLPREKVKIRHENNPVEFTLIEKKRVYEEIKMSLFWKLKDSLSSFLMLYFITKDQSSPIIILPNNYDNEFIMTDSFKEKVFSIFTKIGSYFSPVMEVIEVLNIEEQKFNETQKIFIIK